MMDRKASFVKVVGLLRKILVLPMINMLASVMVP